MLGSRGRAASLITTILGALLFCTDARAERPFVVKRHTHYAVKLVSNHGCPFSATVNDSELIHVSGTKLYDLPEDAWPLTVNVYYTTQDYKECGEMVEAALSALAGREKAREYMIELSTSDVDYRSMDDFMSTFGNTVTSEIIKLMMQEYTQKAVDEVLERAYQSEALYRESQRMASEDGYEGLYHKTLVRDKRMFQLWGGYTKKTPELNVSTVGSAGFSPSLDDWRGAAEVGRALRVSAALPPEIQLPNDNLLRFYLVGGGNLNALGSTTTEGRTVGSDYLVDPEAGDAMQRNAVFSWGGLQAGGAARLHHYPRFYAELGGGVQRHRTAGLEFLELSEAREGELAAESEAVIELNEDAGSTAIAPIAVQTVPYGELRVGFYPAQNHRNERVDQEAAVRGLFFELGTQGYSIPRYETTDTYQIYESDGTRVALPAEGKLVLTFQISAGLSI